MHFLSWSFKLAVNGSFYGCVMFNPRHWSGSQIRISIRITPNFELVLAMVIASPLTKFHQNPTSTLWETMIRISDFQNPTCTLWETLIQILIRITPNFELGLPMIITSLLTKFHQNPTSSLWELLLANKQTNTRRWLQYPAFRGINTQLKLTIFCGKNMKTPSFSQHNAAII